jgi:(R,R)-butanediol dehydrogenase/meso-butanediol dehydrogenase/diacetyl reductase
VLDRTHGLGADVVYECVGRPETVQSAVDLARRGGRMVLIGLAVEQAPIQPGSWLVKEISVMSSLAYSHEDFEMSMGMIADGRVRLEPMHTSTVGLDDLDGSLAGLAGGVGAQIKVLVDPRAG